MSAPTPQPEEQRVASRRDRRQARRKHQRLVMACVTGMSLLLLSLVVAVVLLPGSEPEPEDGPSVVLTPDEAPGPQVPRGPDPRPEDGEPAEPDPPRGPDRSAEKLARFVAAHKARMKARDWAGALRELRVMRGSHHDHPLIGPELTALETELRVFAEQARLDAEKRITLAVTEGRYANARTEIQTCRKHLASLYDAPLFAETSRRIAGLEARRDTDALIASAREAAGRDRLEEALGLYRKAAGLSLTATQRATVVAALAQVERRLRLGPGVDSAELARLGEALGELEERVGQYLADPKPGVDAVDRIVAIGPSPSLLERVLLTARRYPERPAGVVEKRMQFEKMTEPVYIAVPHGYDPRKSYPMIVYLHGTNMRAAACRQHAQMMVDRSGGRAFGLVPHTQSPHTGVGWGPSQYGINPVFKTIRMVLREYNVDPNRISLTGQSMGGHATWNIGMLHPDWWSALAPKSGCANQKWQRGLYSNMSNLPVYAIHGARDPIVPVKMCRDTIKIVRSLGIDVTYKEYASSGHEGAPWPEVYKSYDWMIAQVRRPLPKKVNFYTRFPRITAAYWVRIDAYDSNRTRFHYRFVAANSRKLLERAEAFKEPPGVQLEVREGNEIRIQSTGVKALTLFLHPQLVDFSRPIKVVRGGRTVKRVEVKADLRTMLRLARDARGVVYWAELPVTLTEK